MQQAGYHHANMLAAQIRNDFEQQNQQMMAMMQTLAENTAPEQTEEPPDAPPMEAPQQTANAVTQDVQQEMLQLLRTMQHAITGNRTTTSGQRARTNQTQSSNAGQGGRINRRTPDNANFNRRVRDKYCHTHGACNHASRDCTRKAPGHRDEATRQDRMGGSNAFCTPATPAAE